MYILTFINITLLCQMSSKQISAPEPFSIPITKKSTIAIELYVSTLEL